MTESLADRIAKLGTRTTAELREQWRTVIGGQPRSHNRRYLLRRLAWAVQANELGGLSARAQRQLERLLPMVESWMPTTSPEKASPRPAQPCSQALAPGTLLTRPYKGRTLTVLVRDDGTFEFEGALYGSLTAIAHSVTGAHWNGYHFFRLRSKGNPA